MISSVGAWTPRSSDNAIDAAKAADIAAAYDQCCSRHVALEISRQIAGNLGLQLKDVLDTLSLVPNNLPDLLASPEGWQLLAQFVADYLQIDAGDYAPTVQ